MTKMPSDTAHSDPLPRLFVLAGAWSAILLAVAIAYSIKEGPSTAYYFVWFFFTAISLGVGVAFGRRLGTKQALGWLFVLIGLSMSEMLVGPLAATISTITTLTSIVIVIAGGLVFALVKAIR